MPDQLAEGIYVARSIIPHQCIDIPVRVINTSDKPMRIRRGKIVAELEPVTLEEKGSAENSLQDEEWKDELVTNVDEEITTAQRSRLDELLTNYVDCLSRSEFDLGRTSLVEHGIETGMNAPIRQALLRQPLGHL